jgi:hypothetical protein
MALKKITLALRSISIDNVISSVPVPVVPGPVDVFGRIDVGRMADPFRGEVSTSPEEDHFRLVTLESFNLFDRSSADAQHIDDGTPFTVDSRAELEVSDGEFMQVAVHLAERPADGGVDNLALGEQPSGEFAFKAFDVDLRTPFDQISDDVLVLGPLLLSSGKRVKVKISVTPAQLG